METWLQLLPTGSPGVHLDACGIYDPVRDRFILIGNGTDQVYALSLGPAPAWTTLAPVGPAPDPRAGATALYDPVRDRLVHFGGSQPISPSSEIVFNDAHALSLDASPTWSSLVSAPEGRAGHVAVYDPVNDRMPVFGGIRGHNLPAPPTVLSLNFGASVARAVEQANEAEREGTAAGTRVELGTPAPNPIGARSAMQIDFAVPQAGHVRLGLYDIQGREVARLADGEYRAGGHSVSADASRIGAAAPGVYFVRLETLGISRTRRAVLVP